MPDRNFFVINGRSNRRDETAELDAEPARPHRSLRDRIKSKDINYLT